MDKRRNLIEMVVGEKGGWVLGFGKGRIEVGDEESESAIVFEGRRSRFGLGVLSFDKENKSSLY